MIPNVGPKIAWRRFIDLVQTVDSAWRRPVEDRSAERFSTRLTPQRARLFFAREAHSRSQTWKDFRRPSGVMRMLDADLARIRAHRNNIHRYWRLLRTRLSDLERQFIERRLAEEQTALDTLAHETLPLEFAGPGGSPLPRAREPSRERPVG